MPNTSLHPIQPALMPYLLKQPQPPNHPPYPPPNHLTTPTTRPDALSVESLRWKSQQPPEAPTTPTTSSATASSSGARFGASSQAADGTLVREWAVDISGSKGDMPNVNHATGAFVTDCDLHFILSARTSPDHSHVPLLNQIFSSLSLPCPPPKSDLQQYGSIKSVLQGGPRCSPWQGRKVGTSEA